MEKRHTLKQLRSFMGSMHHMIKFIPNLSEITAPLRPSLSTKNSIKGSKLKLSNEHDTAFSKIKQAITQIIENKHFDTTKPTRVRCHASTNGLEACLEQCLDNKWYPIAYPSRFLNCNEQKYSTNELELLAFVWSLEHFKYYLFGSKFELQTVHQALLSALKNNRGNKTYQSHLTHWADRLLPFHFKVQHVPGKNMGIADYFSRYPISPAPQPLESDNNYVVNLRNTFKHILKKAKRISSNQNAKNLQHARYDVIKAREQNIQSKHAFCHSRCLKQSHSCNHPNSSLNNLSLYQSNSRFLNTQVPVCTRNNPNSITFKKTIHKRPRAKKMNNIPLQESPNVSIHPNQTIYPKSITIATQIEKLTNKGKGTTPLDPNWVENPFDIAQSDTSIPLANLHKVLNENFISEAITFDNQSNRI